MTFFTMGHSRKSLEKPFGGRWYIQEFKNIYYLSVFTIFIIIKSGLSHQSILQRTGLHRMGRVILGQFFSDRGIKNHQSGCQIINPYRVPND